MHDEYFKGFRGLNNICILRDLFLEFMVDGLAQLLRKNSTRIYVFFFGKPESGRKFRLYILYESVRGWSFEEAQNFHR